MIKSIANTNIVTYLFPLIGGALYSLGFPTKSEFSFFLFPIIGLALYLCSLPISYAQEGDLESLKNSTLISNIKSTLLFSLGYYLIGYYWIPETLKEFGGIFFPFNHLLGVFFSFVIFPQYLFFIILYRLLLKTNLRKSKIFFNFSSRNILLALFLCLLEVFIPQQFPAHVGHAWLQLAPNLSLAPILGSPAYSFFSIWLAFSLMNFLKYKKIDFAGLMFFLLFLALNFISPLHFNHDNEHKINIRMVQPNIGNFIKISSENGDVNAINEVFDRYYQLSTNKLPNTDLIIWPETAYPRLLSSAVLKTNDFYVPNLFKKVINSTNSYFLTGGYDKSQNKNNNYFETEYNAAFLFNKSGRFESVYHKQILIPFGENLPFGPLNSYLAPLIQNISFFAKGSNYTLFNLNDKANFFVAICYEVLFFDYIKNFLNSVERHPHFIVNLTNDSWYGDTAEPLQHKFLAHWRAIEFQLPLVRSTNTGISSILYPDGSESKRLGVGQEAYLDTSLAIQNPIITLFQKYGILLTIAISISIWFLLFLTLGRRKTLF